MEEYLYDKVFLKQLDYDREKEVYIKLTVLNNDDLPKEAIVGKATGGSINIDGSSAIRRTCSLSLVALENDEIITNTYWCYDNKFKLEIGLKNNVDNKYPDIIWFNMGIYIITSFSCTKNTNSLSISISGKDKMCRLNGEVSGNIMASTDFGTIETVNKIEHEDGSIEYQIQKDKIPIKEIIQNAVTVYGQELPYNIIINDLDDYGYELWEYQGNTPIYMFIKKNQSEKEVINITFDENTKVTPVDSDETILISEIEKYYSMNTLDLQYNEYATEIEEFSGCYVAKIEFGQTAGYHQIPLVYNNDLILSAGETITTLLDKIKNMLGDFEYFYDVKGRFVFQKKKTYVQQLFSPIDGEIITPTMYTSQYSYKFEDEKLFTTISDTPNINNLKNDFSVWGSKKTTNNDLPIHARFAIDKKPSIYITPWPEEHNDIDNYSISDYDWRELIYQMALDYYKHNQDNNFLIQIQNYNSQFIEGKTGYEQYYSDMQAFWRELYNPLETDNDLLIQEINNYEYYDENSDYKYWNVDLHKDPTQFKFWFDFLDTEGELGEYSIKKYDKINNQFKTNIGVRTKIVNETTINSIYNRETPEVLFVISGEDNPNIDSAMAYTKIQIQSNLRPLFYKSAQGISAIEKMNEVVYNCTAQANNISITSIPIYYLQPNTRIFINGHGDYSLDKISYSLTYDGTMSISGNKIIKQYY